VSARSTFWLVKSGWHLIPLRFESLTGDDNTGSLSATLHGILIIALRRFVHGWRGGLVGIPDGLVRSKPAHEQQYKEDD
jgi:hypothetical protein